MTDLYSGTRLLGSQDFAVPVEHRYFEDNDPGAVYEYGHLPVSEETILRSAGEFDPQRRHDVEAARTGPFGGIIASGWHSVVLIMRIFVDHHLSHVASLASRG
ncbi:hotdog family protein [Amycolatopsis jiangsuensis]|uniref:Acyl dehydratase n=1 Tax=Amycolatopsis jiangsuensis TaxID=1181879 RepID=A0A840J8B9_9PSEU|nr:hypothetical protein [Amycolatopsis jiangsuensis]MBB4689628.1 acyl dehydratase [Amycolatopsis jiangsuensis]